jgi:hypothetical protein
VKRWARALEATTARQPGGPGSSLAWAELLRRYLLLSRAGRGVSDEKLADKGWATLEDDMVAVQVRGGVCGCAGCVV